MKQPLRKIYLNRAQSWNFRCVKAPGFNDKKGVNINSNMAPFLSLNRESFHAAQIPTLCPIEV
jgi:hypothetical protein